MNFIYQDLRLIGQDERQAYSLYLARALKTRKSASGDMGNVQ